MKRAKKLVAFVTIASLTLATASVAFAADETTAATDEVAEEEVVDDEADAAVEEEAVEEEVAEEEAVPVKETVVAEAKTYDDLSVTDKTFFNDRRESLGFYPEIAGMDDLNKKIYDSLHKDYAYLDYNTVNDDFVRNSNFEVSYTVENNNRYAAVTVSYTFLDANDGTHPYDKEVTYFIDKETKAEITEEDYDSAIAEATEEAPLVAEAEEEEDEEETAAAEEVSIDAVMLPLRANAELLGYELGYDAETKAVKITKDDFITTIVADVNSYTVEGQKVELDAAPTNQEGSIYVPVSFFEKVLGYTVSIDKDGYISFDQEDAE